MMDTDDSLTSYAIERKLFQLIGTGNVTELNNFFTNAKTDTICLNCLAASYEEVKFKNIQVSSETEFFVENKLLELRFLNVTGNENSHPVLPTLDNIKCQAKLMLSLLTSCIECDTSTQKDEFVLKGIMAARHMHILKHELRTTYDKLPWEEIEFCLLNFISTLKDAQCVDDIYKLVLHEDALKRHMYNFKKQMENVMETLTVEDVKSKRNFNRMNVKKLILTQNREFERLYSDYDLVRDVHSLKRISSYLVECSQIEFTASDKKNNYNKLLIKRTLQSIGELLNYSLQSPNISEEIKGLLVEVAPEKLLNLCINIRHTLAHVDVLSWQLDPASEDDATLYDKILNDLKKIQIVINNALNNRKCAALIYFFEKILKTDDLKKIRNLGNKIRHVKFNDIHSVCVTINEMKELKCLILQLQNSIPASEVTRQLFEELNGILNEENHMSILSLTMFKENEAYDILNKCVAYMCTCKDLDLLHTKCQIAIKILSVHNENTPKLSRIKNIITKIESSVKLTENATTILNDVIFFLHSTGKVTSITKYHTTLKYAKASRNYADYIDKIVGIYLESIDNDIVRETMLGIFLSKKNLHNMKKQLLNSTNNRKSLDELNGLLSPFKLNKKVISRFQKFYLEDNIVECSNIISKIDDKYDALFKKLSEADDNIAKQIKALNEFLKSITSKGEFRPQVLENIIMNNIHAYFDDVRNSLNEIIISDPIVNCKVNIGQQMAIEMLLLELLNILEVSGCLPENLYSLYNRSPILMGRMLRNYLAHGSLLVDSLPFDTSTSILCNALRMINEKDIFSILAHLTNSKTFEDVSTCDQTILEYMEPCLEIFTTLKMFNTSVRTVDANVSVRNCENNNLLHVAAITDNIDAFVFLISNGLNPLLENLYGKNPFDLALEFGSQKIMCHYLQKNISGKSDDEILGIISKHGQIELFKSFLEHKRVDERTKLRAICEASAHGHFTLIESLLEEGTFQNNFHEALLLASQNGHLEVVVKLLSHGASASAENNFGLTPLQLACFNGHSDIAEVLINNGANINYYHVNRSPLIIAVMNNDKDLINLLLAKGANVDHQSPKDGLTALHIAANLGYKDMAELLLKAGANVDIRDFDDDVTPLMAASIYNNLDVVELLIEHNYCDINLRCRGGIVSAVHLATQFNHKEIVQYLINKGICLNDDDFSLLIYMACLNGNNDIAKILIRSGLNPNHSGYVGFPPLLGAIKCKQNEIFNALVEVGADITLKLKNDVHLLHVAANFDCVEMARTMLSLGVDVNVTCIDATTPLHIAAHYGNISMINFLLENGGDLTAIDVNGRTPLLTAAGPGHTEIVELLLKAGADVNVATNEAYTPLAIAALCDYPEMAAALLKHGAAVNMPIITGKSIEFQTLLLDHTPLLQALLRNNEQIIDLLLEAGAAVDIICSDGFTPLHFALESCNSSVIKKLLERGKTSGIDIDAKNDSGLTPLFGAVYFNKIQALSVLIDYGANVNCKSSDGSTPLHVACANENFAIVKLLIEAGADITVKNDRGLSILHRAALNENEEVLRYILEYNKEKKKLWVNCVDNSNMTPLHLYIVEGSDKAEFVKLFVENEADVNCNNHQEQILSVAISKKHFNVVLELLKQGINIKDTVFRFSILHHLVLTENKFIIKEAIQSLKTQELLDINADYCGVTPLLRYTAVGEGNPDILKILVDNGANINILSKEGFSPLSFVVSRNLFASVRELLNLGADIFIQIQNHHTILHEVVLSGNSEMISLVIEQFKEHGSLDCRDSEGDTALMWCAENGIKCYESAILLLANGASVSVKNNNGKTALDWAHETNEPNMIELILGASVFTSE